MAKKKAKSKSLLDDKISDDKWDRLAKTKCEHGIVVLSICPTCFREQGPGKYREEKRSKIRDAMYPNGLKRAVERLKK